MRGIYAEYPTGSGSSWDAQIRLNPKGQGPETDFVQVARRLDEQLTEDQRRIEAAYDKGFEVVPVWSSAEAESDEF